MQKGIWDLKSIIITAAALACGTAWADLPNAVDGVITLTADVETAKFYPDSSVTKIDLNGHALTIREHFQPTATTDSPMLFTNSATGDAARLTISNLVTRAVGSSEFKKVKFGGNLALLLKDIQFNESSGFGANASTHTGGTILDHVYPYNSEGGKAPIFSNASAFGTGALTLRNGTHIRDTASHTYAWSELNVTGTEASTLSMEKLTTLNAGTKVNIAKDSILYIEDMTATFAWGAGDFSGVLGKISFKGSSSQKSTFTADIENGTLMVTSHEIRNDADAAQGNWKLGGLASPSSVTASDSSALLRRTGGTGGKMTLEVGSANRDETWYGQLVWDGGTSATSTKDWNVLKVGTGTWTVGGCNYYHGTTEIREGAIKLLKTGEIGDSGTAPAINMTGGALYIPSDIGHNPIARMKTTTSGVAAKLGVSADDTLTVNQSLANLTEGLTKVGAGTMVLGATAADFGGALTLEDGVLRLNSDTDSSDLSTITFAGGTLQYGEGVTTGHSTAIKNSTGALSVDTAGNDVEWTNGSLQSNNASTKGITKKGEGTLKITSYDNNTVNLFASASYTNRIEEGTLAIINMKRGTTQWFRSKVLGTGTLRIYPHEDKGGWRFEANGALEEFEGTVDFANDQSTTASDGQTAAIGFLNKSSNLNLSKLRWSFTGTPATDTDIVRNEVNAGKTLTFGALDVLSEHAQLHFNNAINITIAGGKGESKLNGQFINKAITFTKNGTDTLTIGTGFKTVDGSSLTVNAGTLVVEAGATLPKLDNKGTLKVDISDWTDCGTTTTKELFTTTADATLGTVEFVGGAAGYTFAAAPDENGKVIATATAQGKRWTDASGDHTWSTAENWSGNEVPGDTDNVIFDSDATVICTADTKTSGKMYVNGTVNLTTRSDDTQHELYVGGTEGSGKLVMTAAYLSNPRNDTKGTAADFNVAMQIEAGEKSQIKSYGATSNVNGPITGTGTLQVTGWFSGGAVYLYGDNSGFEGSVIWYKDNNNSSKFATNEAADLSQATMIWQQTSLKSFTVDKDVDTIKFGAFRTQDADGNALHLTGNAYMRLFCETVTTVEIGALNHADDLMGLTFGDRGKAYARLRKVGTGTLEVYDARHNYGTEINGGTLLVTYAEALSGNNMNDNAYIAFNGGTLKYGYDSWSATPAAVTTDWSKIVKGSSEAIKVETTGADVTWATALADSNTKHEIVKTGKGRLILTKAPAWNSDTDKTTVTVGYRQGSVLMPTTVSYVLGSDSGHATRVKTTTIGDVTYNEFYNQPGLAVIVR